MYKIVMTKHAARTLKNLGRLQKNIIIKAIDSLANNPYKGYPLKRELKGFYKLRISNYRIVYEIRHKSITVVVIGIGHRKDVYETLSRRVRLI